MNLRAKTDTERINESLAAARSRAKAMHPSSGLQAATAHSKANGQFVSGPGGGKSGNAATRHLDSMNSGDTAAMRNKVASRLAKRDGSQVAGGKVGLIPANTAGNGKPVTGVGVPRGYNHVTSDRQIKMGHKALLSNGKDKYTEGTITKITPGAKSGPAAGQQTKWTVKTKSGDVEVGSYNNRIIGLKTS